jgi:hypothetical protein
MHTEQQALQDVEEGSSWTKLSEEEMRQRKSRAVLSWLVRARMQLCVHGLPLRQSFHDSWVKQEHSVGKERVELVRLLQAHGVVVRGGAEQGQRLLAALLVCLLSLAWPSFVADSEA